MKKFIALITVISLSLGLVACGGGTEKTETPKETKSASSELADKTAGKVEEKDGLRKEIVRTIEDLNEAGSTGPINYIIEGVQICKLTPTNDEMASFLEIEKGTEVVSVSIKASAENTSDETINFYLGQAVLTTDTKEQVESDMWLSEHIEGEFLGKVKHSGSNVYILKNSKAEDIKTLTLHVDAPSDGDFSSIGEEVKINIVL